MNQKPTKTILWTIVFFLLIFLPIVLLFIFPYPEERTFLREASVIIGFVAMSLMGFQLIPTSRVRLVARNFPLEKFYDVHHKLSIISAVLVLLHPILLFFDGVPLRILNIFAESSSWRIQSAVLSVVAVIILIITSVWRKPIKLRYDIWRYLHNLMTYLAVGLGLWHMFIVNRYLAHPVNKVVWIGLTALWVLMILIVKLIKPLMLAQKPYAVKIIKQERNSSWSLELQPVGHPGFKYSAGQFAWISTKSPLVYNENPFSFSSNADVTDGSFSLTIKELGDFTAKIKQLKPGDRVFVDGPYGSFSVDKFACRQIVFIAGGIGSAPVMSMLRTLASRKDERQIIFVYGNPGYEDIIYREELETLQKQLNLKLIHVLENPPADWQGEQGYITQSILARHLPENYKDWIYFLCGPLPMTNAVGKCLHALHIPEKHIHLEKYEMA